MTSLGCTRTQEVDVRLDYDSEWIRVVTEEAERIDTFKETRVRAHEVFAQMTRILTCTPS